MSEGLREKKAVSLPEINPESKSKTKSTTKPSKVEASIPIKTTEIKDEIKLA